MKNELNQNTTFPLDQVFKEKTEYVKYSFEVYKKIYDFKTIKYIGEVSEELFNYVKNKKYFLLLTIYDEAGRIYLERTVQDKLYWSLPGGSVHKDEDLHIAVKRIANKIRGGLSDVLIGEIEPIAFIENEFCFKNDNFIHYGIAFMARIRSKDFFNSENTEGNFVFLNNTEIENINRYANREVVKLCQAKLKERHIKFPEKEVFTNEKNQFRYFFHKTIMKKFILTPKLKRKKDFIDIIKKSIEGAKSMLDISCGDSDLLFQLAKRCNFDYAVGNDISWSQINSLSKDYGGIIHTNHNSVTLPFKENSFDVSYCGNTLHHLNTEAELLATLDNLFKASRKVIVVEIEKPSDTGLLAWLLNKYWYQKFLGDVGDSYLSKKDFQSIISSHFSQKADIIFSEFKNIQGRYLIAEIKKNKLSDKKNKVFEIEQKFYCKDIKKLENILKREGFRELEEEEEIDDYYSDLDGDFIRNRTCLRIRQTKEKAELTHKGKSHSFSGPFTKVEHNLLIQKELIKEYDDILNSLGFFRYVTVHKKRHSFFKNEGSYKLTVSIDKLLGIGNFIELEAVMDFLPDNINEDAGKSKLNELINILKECRLKPANLPYRDYVADYQANKFLKKEKTKTILFDLDGTIVPTEKPFFESFNEIIIKKSGINIGLNYYLDHEMSKNDDMIKELKRLGINLGNEEDLMKEVYGIYELKLEKIFSHQKVADSLGSIIALKENGYRIALITTSRRSFVNKILKGLNGENLFEVIIAREDVKNYKPNPEAYIAAMKKLNVSADECLVIEDSKRGLESALKAGVNCVLVAENTLFKKTDLIKLGAPVFDNITQICMILKHV